MSSRVLKHGTNQITAAYTAGHKAVDLVKYKSQRDTVIAHSDGKVVFCQTGKKNNKLAVGNASYGNCVKIDHGGGVETLYAHLATVAVTLGQTVKQGQEIGMMGNTGRSFGAHLHFEVRKNGTRVDPTPYLEADLPARAAIPLRYRVFVSGRWLPWVTECGDGPNGYAGVFGQAVSALQLRPETGVITYRVHQLGGGWLPWVTSQKSWAGVRGKPIDAVQMTLDGAEGYALRYRVTSLSTSRWHGWCTGLTDSTGDGYAGVLGSAVDGVQAEIVRV